MSLFLEILNNSEGIKMIDSINEINKNCMFLDHSRKHALSVVSIIENLFRKLNYDERIIELGKITGLLHDIGCINGKKEHAKTGSKIANEILKNYDIDETDRKIIIQAIYDHSHGENITSVVGAGILIADKIDLVSTRLLDLAYVDKVNWQVKVKDINDVKVEVIDNIITINYSTNPDFARDIFDNEWNKGITLPIKASKYLGYKCKFKINDIELQP